MPETRKTKEMAEDGESTIEGGPAEYKDMQKMMLMMQENSMRMQEQQAIAQQQLQQQMAQMMTITSGLLNRQTDNVPATRARRPDRPVIDFESTETDWEIFKEDWSRYKQMSMLLEINDIRNELRAACSKEVNRMLFSFIGPGVLKNANEAELLDFIKLVSVRSVHKEVHRQDFKVMKQEDGETITRFTARLKAKAMQCKFSTQCDVASCVSKCSYADEMISSQLISGVRNNEHRGKILAEMEELETLQKLIDRLLALECTQKASGKFYETPTTSDRSDSCAAAQSGYKKQQNKVARPKFAPNKTEYPKKHNADKPKYPTVCQGCGMRSHGASKTMVRDQDCPAWGQKCHKCNQMNHFQAACRGLRSRTSGTRDEDSDEEPADVSFISATRSRSDSF